MPSVTCCAIASGEFQADHRVAYWDNLYYQGDCADGVPTGGDHTDTLRDTLRVATGRYRAYLWDGTGPWAAAQEYYDPVRAIVLAVGLATHRPVRVALVRATSLTMARGRRRPSPHERARAASL
jgi:hypothetical protein